MKIYFDTNIVIDILERREPYYKNSNEVFLHVINDDINGIIGTSSVTDIYYLVRRRYKDSKTTIRIIIDILEIIKPVDTLVNDIFRAADLDFIDFEDAVVAAVAQREKADYIITRNTQDFSKSAVQAVTPEDFLVICNGKNN